MSGWGDDDAIGYGRPPIYTQFQKGRSGNPRGRPKKSRAPLAATNSTDAENILRDLYNEKLTVTGKGGTRKITAFQAVAMRQRKDALEGSVTAQREVIRTMEKLDAYETERKLKQHEDLEIAAAESAETDRMFYTYLVRYHASQTQNYRCAHEAGTNPEPRYPHPDDFRFDHFHKQAHIDGPWDAEHAQLHHIYAKQRDYHLFDYILLWRQRPKGSRIARQLAALQINTFDQMLSKRKRLDRDKITDIVTVLLQMPINDLRTCHKELAFWLKLHPLREPSKQMKRDTKREVSAAMLPLVKLFGCRSLAQFERRCEQGVLPERVTVRLADDGSIAAGGVKR